MQKLQTKLGIGLTVGLALLLANPVSAGTSDTNDRMRLKLPSSGVRRDITRTTHGKTSCAWRSNTLLVMPCKSSDDGTLDELSELKGTVVRTIGQGSMTVWEVAFPDSQHFVDAEKKLAGDKKFSSVQRDYVLSTKETTTDGFFSSEWYLNALNVPAAWDLTHGSPAASIAVIDTGVNTSTPDLLGKCFTGYDAVLNTTSQNDVEGHGTSVSTTAAALANNGNNTVGPARLSTIYPIRAGQPDGSFYTADILDGFYYAINNTPVRLINFSVNGQAPYTIANKAIHSTLHSYFKTFHDVKGGLIFNAAGNDHLFDPNPLLPYLIVVSALGEPVPPLYANDLAWFSNSGNCIWFSAPGENIYCSDKDNSIISISGTSFSSPLTCSIAALIWGAKPSLTNLQVESIMMNHTTNPGAKPWNTKFGYGIPDARACVQAALGTTTTTPGQVVPPKTKKKNPNKLWKKKN